MIEKEQASKVPTPVIQSVKIAEKSATKVNQQAVIKIAQSCEASTSSGNNYGEGP